MRKYVVILFKYYCSFFCLASCSETIDINPTIQAAFKNLELSSFVMICDSINDTIEYTTKGFILSYNQTIYSKREYQNILLYASIEEKSAYENFTLLSMECDQSSKAESEIVKTIFTLYKFESIDLFENKSSAVTINFNKQFVLDGINYENCYIFERPNSDGIQTKYFVYSPIFGFLQVISTNQNLVYRRCFDCE